MVTGFIVIGLLGVAYKTSIQAHMLALARLFYLLVIYCLLDIFHKMLLVLENIHLVFILTCNCIIYCWYYCMFLFYFLLSSIFEAICKIVD